MTQGFRNRYPTYNVLDKWDTPSWNDQTRAVVAKRLHEIPARRFFSETEWELAQAICDRLIPQPDRPDEPVPIVPFIDEKLHENQGNGYRYDGACRRSARPGDRPARDRRGGACPLAARLSRAAAASSRTRCCARCSTATRSATAWQGMPPKRFFSSACCARRSPSITRTRRHGARSASAARPRRAAMSGCRLEPARPVGGDGGKKKHMSGSPLVVRGPRTGARPTCCTVAAGCRCAASATRTRSISPSSGPARAAARWPAGWPRPGFRWSRSTPARSGARSRISRRTSRSRTSSSGSTSGSSTATTRSSSARNNSGRSVGGSTVHFPMVSLRFRPEWFKARSMLGYGVDWPVDLRRCGTTTARSRRR